MRVAPQYGNVSPMIHPLGPRADRPRLITAVVLVAAASGRKKWFRLTVLRQDEIEDRPQHELTWTRRAGGARGGDDSRRRALQGDLLEDAGGSHKPASATLHRADFVRVRASLIDQPRDRAVVEHVLRRGEPLGWRINIVGGGGPGAEALIGPDPGTVDVTGGVNRPVDIEVIVPLRRAAASVWPRRR